MKSDYFGNEVKKGMILFYDANVVKVIEIKKDNISVRCVRCDHECIPIIPEGKYRVAGKREGTTKWNARTLTVDTKYAVIIASVGDKLRALKNKNFEI
jgi:hypothetical protein